MPRENKKEIKNSQEMKKLLQDISFDSAVLFDLDNTVMQSQLELGSDQWFVHLCIQVGQKISENEKAIALAIVLYHEVQKIVRTQAVEETTIKIINTLQDIGIPVIAITARDECLQAATRRQLTDIDIDFDTLNIPKLELKLPGNQAAANPIYERGIIYCAGQDKGRCFKAFLDATQLKWQHIVMADDKGKYLEQVGDVCITHSLKIAFNGIRYGHLDQKVAAFDMLKAQEQLASVTGRLPDDLQQQIKELALSTPNTGAATTYASFFYDRPAEIMPPKKPVTSFRV